MLVAFSASPATGNPKCAQQNDIEPKPANSSTPAPWMGGSPHEASGAYVATSGNAQARAPACRRGASSAGGGAVEESHRRERHVPSSGDASRMCVGRCASCRPASHSLRALYVCKAPHTFQWRNFPLNATLDGTQQYHIYHFYPGSTICTYCARRGAHGFV